MGYKNTTSGIEALKVALTDEQVKRVTYQGELIFVKVTLPDGRTAWTLPTKNDIKKEEKRKWQVNKDEI